MKEFPQKFVPRNLPQFNQYKYDRDICYLREAIYEWFIHEKPHEKGQMKPFEAPFDLEMFRKNRTPIKFPEMVKAICDELERLGWKTCVGQMASSLWIYPPDQVPASLPEW